MSTVDQQIEQIEQMAVTPEGVADAVRLSGQFLAAADARWTAAHNSGDDSKTQLAEMLRMGICHADMLFRADMARDAYALCVMLLMAAAYNDAVQENSNSVLALTFLACMTLMRMLPTMRNDEVAHTHLPHITRYLASLAYAHFMETVRTNPCVWHKRAQHWLVDAERSGLIESGTVEIPGGRDNPLTATAIIGDLVGRSRALGLLDD